MSYYRRKTTKSNYRRANSSRYSKRSSIRSYNSKARRSRRPAAQTVRLVIEQVAPSTGNPLVPQKSAAPKKAQF